jgi:hypothetical protein
LKSSKLRDFHLILKGIILNEIEDRAFLIISRAYRILKKKRIINTVIRNRKYDLTHILSSQLIYDFDPAIIGNAEMKFLNALYGVYSL